MDQTDDETQLDFPTQSGADCGVKAQVIEALKNDLQDHTTHSGTFGTLVGCWVNDYEIIREIGRGGMGVVYLAKQRGLDRLVALKIVVDHRGMKQNDLQRFFNEARAAGSLDHPGIIPVYEIGEYSGCPFYTMAYVRGKSLEEILRTGPLKPKVAAEICRDLARSVEYAHQHGIIHRDIKPANILIDDEGSPKLADFGVCKRLASVSELTMAGELIGTPHYMPPEQTGSEDIAIGPASDVYSIGAVMYAMLTGRPPFLAASLLDIVAQVMTKEPITPSRLAGSIPGELETIVLKCLAKNPHQRYPSAGEVAEEFERFLAGLPIRAKPPGVISRWNHAIRKHVLLASFSSGFVVTVVTIAILLAVGFSRSQSTIVRLQELLELERQSTRRFVGQSGSLETTKEQFEVERLADLAVKLADNDVQASMHVAVYAMEVCKVSSLTIPLRLEELIDKMLEESTGIQDNPQPQSIEALLERVRLKLTRELTEFEKEIYGIASQ